MATASDDLRQSITDDVYLRLVSIGFWVSAGVDAFFSLIGAFYAALGGLVGVMIATAPVKDGQPPPPESLKYLFFAFGLGFFLFFVTQAILKALSAKYVSQRRGRALCIVIAALSCLGIPWGTAIGVCTLMVLTRPSVAAQFAARAASPATPGQ